MGLRPAVFKTAALPVRTSPPDNRAVTVRALHHFVHQREPSGIPWAASRAATHTAQPEQNIPLGLRRATGPYPFEPPLFGRMQEAYPSTMCTNVGRNLPRAGRDIHGPGPRHDSVADGQPWSPSGAVSAESVRGGGRRRPGSPGRGERDVESVSLPWRRVDLSIACRNECRPGAPEQPTGSTFRSPSGRNVERSAPETGPFDISLGR